MSKTRSEATRRFMPVPSTALQWIVMVALLGVCSIDRNAARRHAANPESFTESGALTICKAPLR